MCGRYCGRSLWSRPRGRHMTRHCSSLLTMTVDWFVSTAVSFSRCHILICNSGVPKFSSVLVRQSFWHIATYYRLITFRNEWGASFKPDFFAMWSKSYHWNQKRASSEFHVIYKTQLVTLSYLTNPLEIVCLGCQNENSWSKSCCVVCRVIVKQWNKSLGFCQQETFVRPELQPLLPQCA